ncbi:ScyD/ScyE family protein [Nocardioides sp. L-11A]|uniref:ScyD/ScyE family protein n=1 Tax=Nocardioides sp. L-11A TaxID=3043848 RepID=UPI00249C9890|nr:ScyD/ScyE family protein [Nocardioides sp. L-11A]
MGKAAIRIGTAAAAFALAATGIPAVAGQAAGQQDGGRAAPKTVASLMGPRGVDALGNGRTLVTETGGTFSLVIERRHRPARVIPLGNLPTDFPPAIAKGPRGTIYLLTGASGPPPEQRPSVLRGAAAPAPAATLFRWKRGWPAPRVVADIGAYQKTDPDPWDQEQFPTDSNPFGVVALDDGTVLVSDAAGNDLLRVWPRTGRIRTVARLMPRTVPVPAGLPDVPPEMGGPLPPAGTPIPSEAVATSVTVGADGYWYVGELRGFPATPGTSQVWRIRPGAKNATCDPARPRTGSCQRYADGFTSITDLAAGPKGVYALELSKKSWFAFEMGLPGAQEGGLFLIRPRGTTPRVRELAAGRLVNPGGVDVSDHVYVAGPLFGPGALLRLR